MKLVKDDQELLISEIQEGKVYKGWHLHFTCEKCHKNVVNKNWYKYKRKIKKNMYLCLQCFKKQTNLERYGFENPSQNEDVKSKRKKTFLNKYGVENPSQNEDVKSKRKKTFLNKYGVENPSQNEDVKNRREQTNLKKYGVKYPLQNEGIKKKTKENNLKKYGIENPFQNEEVKNKIKETNFRKYGVQYPLQNEGIREKIKQTNLGKYGVENISQNEEIKQKAKVKALEKHFLSLYNKFIDLTPLFSIKEYGGINKEYPWKCECGHEFYDHLMKGRKPRCLKCYPRQKQTSQYEEQIVTFLKELGIDNIISNSRDIIAPHELDIYLPDSNLAIEFDGLWWHSNEYKDKFYHLDKTNECLKRGIDLIHIFEDEWIEKNNIVKSIIKSRLGISDKIYARKCIIKKVDRKDTYEFLELNHIQGSISSPINYGLYFNDKLVSLLCLGKSRFNKNYDYEIHRFCNRLNTSVIGGFSKLLKYFQKEYSGSIITYADKRYFTGSVYRNNGFEELEPSKPNYFYIKGEKRYGRLNFQKHKLEDKLDEFYEELTEKENMIINGYNRIHDCGNYVFTKI